MKSNVRNTIVKAFVVAMLLLNSQYAIADSDTVASLVDKYSQAVDDSARKDVYKKLSTTDPKSQNDMDKLRSVFKSATWDEILFAASAEAVKRVKDPSLDKTLIDILKDEKNFTDKLSRKDLSGKSEQEARYRMRNVEVVIQKLGSMKSQNAVPILKEYLAIQGAAYWASEALAQIGEKSASSTMQEKAYKGDEINYAGQGSSEALNVIKDLQDQNKKDQWPKIAKQIINIKDRSMKPYLKELFNHESMDVRWEAAGKFRAMADESDVPTILEMMKNNDHIIRTEAIDAMRKLKNVEFGEELIALLSDPDYLVRLTAAKAIGLKKITRAVPALEKALTEAEQRANSHATGSLQYSNELRVCEEAYIALYILTGKKYDFKGKTKRIERLADMQKK